MLVVFLTVDEVCDFCCATFCPAFAGLVMPHVAAIGFRIAGVNI